MSPQPGCDKHDKFGSCEVEQILRNLSTALASRFGLPDEGRALARCVSWLIGFGVWQKPALAVCGISGSCLTLGCWKRV